MDTGKKKRGRPPKRKAMEFEGMTYEGAINNALDKEVAAELDDTLAHKSEGELNDDERKYLKRKREKKSYTLSVSSTVTRTRPSISVTAFVRELISRPTETLMRKSTRL